MLQNMLKFFVLLAILVTIPLFWWQAVTNFSGFKPFLVSTGLSLFLLGLCYKLMGTWDLIPDWIPLLGDLDDSVAWIAMILGVLLGGGGLFL